MGTITLSLPDALKEKIAKVEWVNWSSVARTAFEEKLEDIKALESKKRLERVKQLVAKSTFTEEDADEMGRKISESLHKRYRERFPGLR